MPTSDQITLLSICRIKGLSWYLIAREAMRSGGLDRLLDGRIREHGRTAKTLEVLREGLTRLKELRAEVEKMVDHLDRDGIGLTTVLDKDYPANLRAIFNKPPFLFYWGELKDDDAVSVAVVGTREPSERGGARAAKMARLLSKAGVTVLSGLAKGIDTAAHRAALDAEGRTIAVLGSGLNRIYPKENAPLAAQIAENGAVVSQFWPDAPPRQANFPRRNITMSGLGQGTVVIEASATSGAKMQARLAIEHGKQVFLLDSLVKEHGWARQYVEERGAHRIASVDDILNLLRSPEEIKAQVKVDRQLRLAL